MYIYISVYIYIYIHISIFISVAIMHREENIVTKVVHICIYIYKCVGIYISDGDKVRRGPELFHAPQNDRGPRRCVAGCDP